VLVHAELDTLAVAHLDCDAFYAAVEKRDDPALRDRPVIVGGGRRGVVSACCYIARMYGVRSAMPMFKALELCPDAAVVRPNMDKYAAVGRQVRALMRETTPLVEPLSIDEAFLDLTGTESLHGMAPSATLARLQRRIEGTLSITASIGLSHNKFLAKLASDLDKPRGFSIIGRRETADFLAPLKVRAIWGVGPALERKLAEDGITRIRHLRELDERTLAARYGAMGRRLAHLAWGEDTRKVEPESATKSISAETTFERDIKDARALASELWPLAETVSQRLKTSNLAGGGVALKLKTADFRIRTRHRRLAQPTQLAETIYQAALGLLEIEATGTAFRLIGVGADTLEPAAADAPDLFKPEDERARRLEDAIDKVRAKSGKASILKGRGL
jgi:DNA polymerase-4